MIPIDTADGWRDINGTWAKVRGVSVDGAVLVRPDGHVGWRTAQAPVDRMRAIGEALGTVLGPI